MTEYEVDIREHINRVRHWIAKTVRLLYVAGILHDQSKLREPEQTHSEKWRAKLNAIEHGSPEYDRQLIKAANWLEMHYSYNRHHPEHFANGIAGMTLIDLTEMLCDWMAACERKGKSINWDYAQERFNIKPQLLSILKNTEKALRKEERI